MCVFTQHIFVANICAAIVHSYSHKIYLGYAVMRRMIHIIFVIYLLDVINLHTYINLINNVIEQPFIRVHLNKNLNIVKYIRRTQKQYMYICTEPSAHTMRKKNLKWKLLQFLLHSACVADANIPPSVYRIHICASLNRCIDLMLY